MAKGVTLTLPASSLFAPLGRWADRLLTKKPLPLRWHLTRLCAGVMFPILALMGFMLWYASAEERERMESEAQNSAVTVASDITRDIGALTATMQALSHAEALQDGNLRRFHNMASRLTVVSLPNVAVVLMDLNGQQLVNTRLPFGTALPYGNPESREAIPEILATKKPWISSVFIGTTAKEPIFVISVPVFRSGTEDVTHILHLSMPVERLRSIILGTVGQEQGIGLVTDAEHRTIARNRGHENYVTKVSPMVYKAARDDDGILRSVTMDGTPVTVFQVPVKDTPWKVSVGIADERLNAPARRFAIMMGATSILMLLLSFLIATVIGRVATRSLHAVVGSAEALGRGDAVLPVTTPVQEVNEVSEALVQASQNQRKAVQNRDVLLNELNHRVKNTLSTIQSMATQTARHHPQPGEFLPIFEARLLGLSASHNLLTQTAWDSADLWDIAQVELSPVLGDESTRWAADGPMVRLKPEPTVAIGMALRELATNAAKYGALSNDKGRVLLRWGVVGDEVELVWREVGGPAVAPPTRRAYGSRLIPSVVRQIDGRLEMDYHPEGVRCKITFGRNVLA